MADRFQARPAAEFLWADLAGQHGLFDRASGRTHFVNDATRMLLSDLLASPRTAEEAAAALAPEQGTDAAADLQRHLAELLPRLQELGLVRRC